MFRYLKPINLYTPIIGYFYALVCVQIFERRNLIKD